MTEVQNQPKPNAIRTKKYWRNMALAVVAAVAITVLVTASIFSGTQATINGSYSNGYAPGSYSHTVLSEPIVLNPNGLYLTGFEVPEEAENPMLQGNFTVVNNTTSKKAATFTVWTQQEFLNYFSNENAVPCYNKAFMPMPQDTLNVTLSKGYYLILIGGAGVNSEIAVFEAQITLNFTIPQNEPVHTSVNRFY